MTDYHIKAREWKLIDRKLNGIKWIRKSGDLRLEIAYLYI
ncbi:MAG: hypothetical protein P857_715 [Candidatus Xenolissoclinum pacificiensis L6]|uniref:Transposase n=1 Tax=Candidatus Xenolissoclinum pacificiensis L6 TaxID=1401685 RepID=W2UZ57_9RICK|nr:MAG: hypothetical protein P857_715 [Candidatus Xenolissoclinum pacificiensis L6]